MLFNSLHFVAFYLVFLVVFFLIPIRFRWVVLLVASYYFYMTWKWQYISLLLGLTIINYFLGIFLDKEQSPKPRKYWLVASVIINVGILFYFKYFNFFLSSVNSSFSLLGSSINIPRLDILLPLGISFFIFQKLSYLIEIYYRRFSPEKNFGMFAVFCSYFPQLIAGPIERPQNLLPQLNNLQPFNYNNGVLGLRLILWGLFKKVVVADRLCYFANTVFNHPQDYHGLAVIIATIFFSFQIYCDFSGYSDIALGTARVMGVELMKNFNTPYFAKSIKEFWSRWHISLSTWFRDYFYISIGGNRVSLPRWGFNLFLTFLVSGVWHGASWTFIIWGGIHGLVSALEAINDKLGWIKFKFPNILSTLITFSIVAFAWIFFRANSLNDALILINHSIDFSHPFLGEIKGLEMSYLYNLAIGFPLIILLLIIESGMKNSYFVDVFHQKQWFRYGCYVLLCLLVAMFGVFVEQSDFIYFQF